MDINLLVERSNQVRMALYNKGIKCSDFSLFAIMVVVSQALSRKPVEEEGIHTKEEYMKMCQDAWETFEKLKPVSRFIETH